MKLVLGLGSCAAMSLALVQGYESSEEEERPTLDSSEDDDDAAVDEQEASPAPLQPPKSSLLPSPLDAFAEITGPPDFLKHSVKEPARQLPPASALSNGQEKRGPSTGAVVEAKPLLVTNTASVVVATETDEALPRILRPQNPPPEDAANLLRMCVQCGVPKTFSGARMICPVCKDRPREDIELDKRKGSKIKDKEKNKRVKGQSSHATWKSETEMQLRQQFD